jgi:hypothetical protein
MRHVDERLALRCASKADYWLNPDIYDDNSIEKLDIGLESVRNAYRTLLHPKSLLPRPGLRSRNSERSKSSSSGRAKARRST